MTQATDTVTILVDLVLDLLKTRQRSLISLDELGELVGDRAISSAEIELLIGQLEAKGIEIGGDQQVDLKGLLVAVLKTARLLQAQGKAAHAPAIAAESGLSLATVRVALLYSEVIRRP